MLFKNAKLIERVRQILGFSGGGVHKRIDENRELLELLQREAPDLLAKNFWIEGWLGANDVFFSDLATAVPIQKGRFLSATQMPGILFPRPWPGKLPVPNVVPMDTRIDGDGWPLKSGETTLFHQLAFVLGTMFILFGLFCLYGALVHHVVLVGILAALFFSFGTILCLTFRPRRRSLHDAPAP